MKAAILALALSCLFVADAGAQLPSAAVPYGLSVNIHPFESYYNLTTDLDMIQASGVKFVRTDLFWNEIETTAGHYDWTGQYSGHNYDALVQACAARGLRVEFGLQYGDPAVYPSDPSSATWRQAYANFAAAAVTHYNGYNNIYQVWQEPDGSWAWPGTPDPSQYMALVNAAVPVMRAADPHCTIFGPDISNATTGWAPTAFLQPCLQQGLANLVDAISVHPYRNNQSPETVVADYTTIRNMISTYHPSGTVPIACSEWGYSCSTATSDQFLAGTAQNQGDYLARMFLVNLSQGIPYSSWYDWKDDGPDATGSQEFGVVTHTGVAKPAYNEMKLLTNSLKGETFTTKLNDRHTSDWLLVFTSPSGQQTLAGWTTGNPRTVTVSGWGTLQLTSTPFYVNPTLLPGDANLDGRVDVLDLAILAANYRKNVTGGWMQADFNHDGVVDVQDLALLAANYRHSLASDVVPAFDGLDAEAIRTLSLAGVTVVPEPGIPVLLGTGLIGLLAWVSMRCNRVFPQFSVQIAVVFACLFAHGGFTRAQDVLWGNMKANSILFLGNSITLHAPEADLNPAWTGNCGMAASAQAKDYVHLLASAIDARTGGNLSIVPTATDGANLASANVVNIADIFERGYATYGNSQLQPQINAKPDMVVLQFGENMNMTTFNATTFKSSLETLVNGLKNSSNPTIFVTSFILASNPTVDAIKQQVCADDPTHRVFVDLSSVYQNSANMGNYGHPNDQGMALIANTLFSAMDAHSIVPEPSFCILLSTGLLAPLAWGWRKRK